MEQLFGTLLSVSLFSLVTLAVLLVWRETKHQKQIMALTLAHSESLEALTQTMGLNLSEVTTLMGKNLSETTRLVSKSQSLLASKDPLAFQQIEAMTVPYGYSPGQETAYDPSDEAEIERIDKRSKGMDDERYLDVNEQQQLLADLTGVDPEFFTYPPS